MSKMKVILSGVHIGLFITLTFIAIGYFVRGRILYGVIESLCAFIQIICLYLWARKPKEQVKVIELSEEESKEFIKKLFETLEESDKENKE